LNLRNGLDQGFQSRQYTRRVLRDEHLQGSHETSVICLCEDLNRPLAPLCVRTRSGTL
jgi:hypothetical protein